LTVRSRIVRLDALPARSTQARDLLAAFDRAQFGADQAATVGDRRGVGVQQADEGADVLELLAAVGLILPAALDIAPVLVPLAAVGAVLLLSAR
jgi:hypothetical protein